MFTWHRSTARNDRKYEHPKILPFETASLAKKIYTNSSAEWSRVEQKHLQDLFERMAHEVPAYVRFLKKNGITRNLSKEYSSIPVMSKANYLRANKMTDLFWNGSMRVPQILTSTSGSTGAPTYFARSHMVDDQSAFIHELIFRSSSLHEDKSTLVIVCFGMGVWIGGVITYQAFEQMGRHGYPVSVITPGINKAEILKILTDLAPHYEQIILAGYPPFLKDVIDEAVDQGISLRAYRVMLLFAAEAFTDRFRKYVCEKIGIKNILTDAINIYGTADIGTMAFETPISIFARRLALENEELSLKLFHGATKTPTLTQFVPTFVSFEEKDGELFLSGDSAVPLMRYAIGDNGGVYSFEELSQIFQSHGINLRRAARDAGIAAQMTELPFVYVYERIDLSTTLYGLQIYPETIKEVLLDERFNGFLTGKLTLITKYDDEHNQYLEINLEHKPKVSTDESFSIALLGEIVKNLRAKNSEFRELSDSLGERSAPKLVFWHYEDPLYFKPGIKQKWVVQPT